MFQNCSEQIKGTGGIEIALKFLVHEQYSLDLSKKIKAAKAKKARRGEYIVKNCAFRFIKTADNHLKIDPVAADTVRLIFTLASERKSTSEIAQLHDTKCSLYEWYTIGEISADEYKGQADEYKGQKAEIDAEINRLNRTYDAITERIARQKCDTDVRAILCEAASRAVGTTQSMVHTLIEKVLVYLDARISIRWKFADLFDS